VLSAGGISRTSDTEATISFTTDEAGTAYYVELASGAAAPTSAAVKSDVNSLGAAAVGANSKDVTLTAGVRDIYVVVEDKSGNISLPLKIEAAAYVDDDDVDAPVLSAGGFVRTGETTAEISFTTDEAGTAYYLVLAGGAAEPASEAVKEGTSLGAVMVGANTGKAVTVTADASNIFVVVEDAAGNISVPLKIEAEAYDPDDTTAPILSAGGFVRTGETTAVISFTTDEAGTAYYLVLASGAAEPASEDVKESTSLGAAMVGVNTGKAVTVTAAAGDIFVVVEDAAGNVSVPIKIEAAAYDPGDITPPVLSGGSVSRTSDTAATITFTTDEAGTAYYVELASGAAAPTNATVKAGTSLGAATLGANSKTVTLTAGARDIYVVVEDAAGNISAVLKIEAGAYIAPDTTAPVLSGGSVTRTSDTAATIGFTTDEAGTAYYLVLASGAAAPTGTAVRAGTSLGAAMVGANTNKSVTLTAGARDIYVVVQDAAGNISAPLPIPVAAFDPSDPWAGFSAGLYSGAPSTLTASSSPIATVAANDLAAAVTFAKANPAEYTLLIDDDINAGLQTLDIANVKLTIIGLGSERTIQFNGATDEQMFFVDSATASLTLGQNITLHGISESSACLVQVHSGSLTMLEGSKITGHSTTYVAVRIWGPNSYFTMEGGEITGNHHNTIDTSRSAGVFVGTNATFTMNGGSITGNTRGFGSTTRPNMDVVISGETSISRATRTGGIIGYSEPPEFAIPLLSGSITISPSTDVTTGTELTATYTGTETVSYQWKRGGTDVGTNSNKYTPDVDGIYTVTVSAAGFHSKTSSAVVVGNPGLPATAGLYLGAPDLISDFISTVAANDVNAAITYAKANPAEYTLLIDDDVNAGAQELNVANVKLTIIGLGQERTIQYNGANGARFFDLNANGASLTLGQNITLSGIGTSTSQLLRVNNASSSLTMLTGSKITGHMTTSATGAVLVLNGFFIMHGGEITGNHTSSTNADASGGVYVDGIATFTMTGGDIIGNTRRDPPEAMDINIISGAGTKTKTGGTIGVSNPPGWGD